MTAVTVAEVTPVSRLGLCLQAGAAAGWCWGCQGGTGRQQLVKVVCDRQEQVADRGQICNWVVTQPSVQLALVFAASF